MVIAMALSRHPDVSEVPEGAQALFASFVTASVAWQSLRSCYPERVCPSVRTVKRRERASHTVLFQFNFSFAVSASSVSKYVSVSLRKSAWFSLLW